MSGSQFSMEYIDQLLKSKKDLIDQALTQKATVEDKAPKQQAPEQMAQPSKLMRKVQKHWQCGDRKNQKENRKEMLSKIRRLANKIRNGLIQPSMSGPRTTTAFGLAILATK